MKQTQHEGVANQTPVSGFFRKNSRYLAKLIPFLGLIAVFTFFALATGGRSVSMYNLRLVLLQAVIIMTGGIGLTFVISHGSMDLSLGGVLSLSAVFGALAGEYSPALTIPVCILTGVVFGFLTAGMHVLLRIPAILISFTVMFFGRGLAGTIVAKKSIRLPFVFYSLDTPLFYFAVFAVLFILAYIVFEYTKIGKYNRAIGSNITAAVMSGIKVGRYKIFAFLISGTLIGICGFLSLLRTGGVTSAASGFEFDVMISLVLGGISLTGGTSVKLRSVIIGGLILSMMGNGLVLLSVESAYVQAIKGLIFLATVAISYQRKRGEIIS